MSMLYIDNKKSIASDDKGFWDKEAKFWNNYGKIYIHLEAATPYKRMLEDISSIISKRDYQTWLDAGCGPGTMIDLILKNQKNPGKIVGVDFDGVMVDQAVRRLANVDNVDISLGDLSKPLDIRDDNFDAIIANLVLSYVIIFDDEYTGNLALRKSLEDMYRVLKEGGLFIWTTPVNGVNFNKVFLASWRQVFNPLTPQYIYYGPRVLSYALQIQNKGKMGIYHFLSEDELYGLMGEIGFKDVKISRTFAKQAFLITASK